MDKTATESDGLLRNNSFSNVHRIEKRKSFRQDINVRDGEVIHDAAYLLRRVIIGDNDIGSNWNYNDDYFNEDYFNDLDRRVMSKNVDKGIGNKIHEIQKKILSNRHIYKIFYYVQYLLLILSFIEQPFWCRHLDGGCEPVMNEKGPPAFVSSSDYKNNDDKFANVDYYPSFNILVFNPDQIAAIEWCCTTILFVYLGLLFSRDGLSPSIFLKANKHVRRKRMILLLLLFLFYTGLVLERLYDWKRPYALFLRIFIFMTFSDSFQRELRIIMVILPETLNILFILLITLIFYGWVGVTAFYHTEEGHDSFSSLIEAMWTLWICVTTANYPDVMMPSFNEYRATNIYFISFMLISYFFIMNVILGSVINSYNEAHQEESNRYRKDAEKHLNSAFNILIQNELKTRSEKGECIEKATVMAVFETLNEDFPNIKYISEEEAEIFFGVLDADGSSHIHRDEFLQFSHLFLLELTKSDTKSLIQTRFPRVYNSNWFQRVKEFVLSERFDNLIDVCIALNAIVIFIQSFPLLAGESPEENPSISDGEIDTVWEVCETIFTCLYCIEMITKILVLSLQKYLQTPRNVFDGAITILSIAATIYVYYPNAFSNSLLIRYIVMARVLRLFRLIMAIPKLQVIGMTFFSALPSAKDTFLLLFVIMYIFAAIGLLLFGGLITRDPNNFKAFDLINTEFAESAYWANNFNDMMSGMNVLFNLIVINNWTVQADGIVAVTDTKLSRLYFLLFHLVGVIIVNNLFVAFVIEAFVHDWENIKRLRRQGSSSDEASQTNLNTSNSQENIVLNEKNEVVFDASKITGTRTVLRGQYVAKIKHTGFEYGMDKHSVLHNLFSTSRSSSL